MIVLWVALAAVVVAAIVVMRIEPSIVQLPIMLLAGIVALLAMDTGAVTPESAFSTCLLVGLACAFLAMSMRPEFIFAVFSATVVNGMAVIIVAAAAESLFGAEYAIDFGAEIKDFLGF